MNPWVKMAVGAAVGAAAGWAMYRFVGCRSGACPLTSNPWSAMVVWGVLGAMAAAGR